MRLVSTILHEFAAERSQTPRDPRPAYLPCYLHVLRSSWAPMRSTWLVSLWTTKSSLTRWAEAIWMTQARRTPKNSPHKLIFLGCLRMKELPTISFDVFFCVFFLLMLITAWKGFVFRESISKDRQPHDWNMIFNEMTSYLDLPKFVELVPVHCHRKKTKPKGKHSTFLEDPNMFIIRVIGPRRKKGSLNLICCFLFFFSQSLGPSSGVIGGSVQCFPVENAGWFWYLGVSKNRGTPKWMVYNL